MTPYEEARRDLSAMSDAEVVGTHQAVESVVERMYVCNGITWESWVLLVRNEQARRIERASNGGSR